MKNITFLLLFLCSGFLLGQQKINISPEAEISVVTCAAGQELYSTFGHSAFRLKDPYHGYDVIYNYGSFDFRTPNFYIKFAQGKLPYQLAVNRFKNFVRIYKYEKRWIKEQVLDLTHEQNQQLIDFLQKNAMPEHRDYKYDFFFDNCATKIRDVLQQNLGNDLVFNEDHLTEENTFRDLIYQNISKNTWSSVGIDIALGSVIDRNATAAEHQYLPYYVFDAINNATINGKPLVKKEALVLDIPEQKASSNLVLSPYFIFSIIAIIILLLTYFDYKKQRRSRWLDFVLFLLNGLGGLLIVLLWFATDHTATANNFNFLWLFLPNLLIAFLLLSKEPKKWISTYITVLLALLLLMLLLWILKMQVFAIGIIPLLIAFAVRYLYLKKFLK